MISALYSGATGVKTHGEGLNCISNNISNVNTVAYKQQSALFQDLGSIDLPSGPAYGQAFSQLGLGAQLGDVRTNFTEGSYEPGNTVTDLALGGKGFFQVTKDDKTHYTRAGDFRFDPNGVLRDPSGFALTGIPVSSGSRGEAEAITIDTQHGPFSVSQPKASTTLTGIFNLGVPADNSTSESNPYFGLLSNWNGTSDSTGQSTPLPKSSYAYSQPLRVYDASGTAHDVTIYFDGTPAGKDQVVEFVVGMDPAAEAGAGNPTSRGSGLLMAGTLTFSGSGQIENMTAFTPVPGTEKANPANWVPASLANGLPQFTASFGGGAPQTLALDLGIRAAQNAWANPVASAADVGTNAARLPSMIGATRAESATTSFTGSPSTKLAQQDGYPKGNLTDLEITEAGEVKAHYSNGQVANLYEIPVYRFTSEDGLRREGMNHYSAPEAAGEIESGQAGTSNYGTVLARTLETSNVDMAREMTSLIVIQRGFQMNSKSITTADSMLQKAMEIKRT